MRLVTNTDLAGQIIARYTSFLSYAAPGADLTFLEPPAFDQPQRMLRGQQRVIQHIHNCIEQNTMVSVNLNLQFLNQMMTSALRQIYVDNRRIAQMLERPVLLERPAETGLIRINAPATQTLLREIQQQGQRPLFAPAQADQAPLPSPRVLLLRSLTQLTAEAKHPAMRVYPAPTAQGKAAAVAPMQPRPMDILPTAAAPAPGRAPQSISTVPAAPLTQTEVFTAVPQNAQRLPLLHQLPPPAVVRAEPTALPPAAAHRSPLAPPTPLAQPLPIQPPRTLKSVTARREPDPLQPENQRAASPMPPVATPLLHPAEEPPAPAKAAPAAQPPTGLRPPLTKAPPATAPFPSAAQKVALNPEPPAATPLLHPVVAMQPDPTPTVLQKAALHPEKQAPASSAFPTAAALLHPMTAKEPSAPPKTAPAEQPPLTLINPATQRQAEALRPVEQPTPILRTHPDAQPGTVEKPTATRPAADFSAPRSPLPFQPLAALQTPMLHPVMRLQKHLLWKRAAVLPSTVPLLAPSPIQRSFLTHPGEEVPQPDRPLAAQRSQNYSPGPNGFELLTRTDAPAMRVLRTEPSRPSPQPSQEPDDFMDIPTIHTKKVQTQEQSVSSKVAINAPQYTATQTVHSAPSAVLSETEIMRITDKVYHVIEGRLHREKMRRGMW